MIINEGLPDTLINKPDRWLYKVELLLSIVFLTVHSTTIGAVTRMRAWVELSRYRIWLMILGERSVADLGCGWSGDK